MCFAQQKHKPQANIKSGHFNHQSSTISHHFPHNIARAEHKDEIIRICLFLRCLKRILDRSTTLARKSMFSGHLLHLIRRNGSFGCGCGKIVNRIFRKKSKDLRHILVTTRSKHNSQCLILLTSDLMHSLLDSILIMSTI